MTEKEKTQLRLKIIREVSITIDKFYSKAEILGELAAKNLTDKHRAQVTGLENIANSALKVTDILNYLKTQTARKQFWRDDQLGPRLIEVVNVDLRKEKTVICQKEGLNITLDSKEGQLVHLYLIREFLRQFAAQYEYGCMVK